LCSFVYFHPQKVELGEMEATFLKKKFGGGLFVCLFVLLLFFETFAILQKK